MISKDPYPKDDERNLENSWVLIRIMSNIPIEVREAIHQMLEESPTIEAHRSGVIAWMSPGGNHTGYCFYVRLL